MVGPVAGVCLPVHGDPGRSHVNVALPSIDEDLGLTATGLAWVVNGHLLTFAGVMLLGGRAADLFSHRRILVAGLTLFAASSLVAGLATAPEILVAARVAQAVAGLLLLFVFTVVEARFASKPMMPLRLFRIRGVAVGNLMRLLLGAVAIAMWYFTSLFLQNVLSYSAPGAGSARHQRR